MKHILDKAYAKADEKNDSDVGKDGYIFSRRIFNTSILGFRMIQMIIAILTSELKTFVRQWNLKIFGKAIEIDIKSNT